MTTPTHACRECGTPRAEGDDLNRCGGCQTWICTTCDDWLTIPQSAALTPPPTAAPGSFRCHFCKMGYNPAQPPTASA